MSEHAQKSFHIYHSSLVTLLQEVRGHRPLFLAFLARLRQGTPTVRVESLVVHVQLLAVWGVLVTTRRGDEILSAWVVAEKISQPVTPQQKAKAVACASSLCQRVMDQVRAMRLQVQTGYYAVPEQAFRQVASFSTEESADSKGGQ